MSFFKKISKAVFNIKTESASTNELNLAIEKKTKGKFTSYKSYLESKNEKEIEDLKRNFPQLFGGYE